MPIRVSDTSYVFKKVSYFIIFRKMALVLKFLTVLSDKMCIVNV